MNVLGSSVHCTMSMRSPASSLTTACTREPLSPTHAPTGSTWSSREYTAIFELLAGRQDGLRLAVQEDQAVASLDLLDRAREQLAHAVSVLGADLVPLLLAHLLD